jgi:hypothetical protein
MWTSQNSNMKVEVKWKQLLAIAALAALVTVFVIATNPSESKSELATYIQASAVWLGEKAWWFLRIGFLSALCSMFLRGFIRYVVREAKEEWRSDGVVNTEYPKLRKLSSSFLDNGVFTALGLAACLWALIKLLNSD